MDHARPEQVGVSCCFEVTPPPSQSDASALDPSSSGTVGGAQVGAIDVLGRHWETCSETDRGGRPVEHPCFRFQPVLRFIT